MVSYMEHGWIPQGASLVLSGELQRCPVSPLPCTEQPLHVRRTGTGAGCHLYPMPDINGKTVKILESGTQCVKLGRAAVCACITERLVTDAHSRHWHKLTLVFQ